MSNSNQGQLTIWGRANSVNVQKVLWCLRELDLAYERIDAGMAFGRNNEPDYLAMNPNGRVPTLVDGDFVLWESNSIMRYLVLAYAPAIAALSASAETRAPASTAGWTGRFRPCSRSIVRCSGRWCEPRSKQRDMVAIQKDADAEAVNGGSSTPSWRRGASSKAIDFTLADIALGAYARRWFGVEGITKPRLAHLERWFAQFAGRPGFQQFVAPPMS